MKTRQCRVIKADSLPQDLFAESKLSCPCGCYGGTGRKHRPIYFSLNSSECYQENLGNLLALVDFIALSLPPFFFLFFCNMQPQRTKTPAWSSPLQGYPDFQTRGCRAPRMRCLEEGQGRAPVATPTAPGVCNALSSPPVGDTVPP